MPFVLIRSVIATFLARGDTATPLKAALIAAVINIAFKLVLTGPLAQVGLALATTIGAWVNFGLVIFFAARQGLLALEAGRARSILKLAAAGIALAAILALAQRPVLGLYQAWPKLGPPAALGGAPPPQVSGGSPVIQLLDRAVRLVGVSVGNGLVPQTAACCSPIPLKASHVATATTALVNTCTSRNDST